MPLTPDQLDNWTTYHPVITDEQCAEALYNTWKDINGFVPWVPGGNAHKQDDARRATQGTGTDLKYAAIRDAEAAMHNAIFNAVYFLREGLKRPDSTMDLTLASLHSGINATTRAFLVVIDTTAPDSADKTAAIRCARLARNAANEAIQTCQREGDTPIHRWTTVDVLEQMAHTEVTKARWQACSAIACGGK